MDLKWWSQLPVRYSLVRYIVRYISASLVIWSATWSATVIWSATAQQQPWSPIIGGQPVIPPLVPPAVTLLHTPPVVERHDHTVVKNPSEQPVEPVQPVQPVNPVQPVQTGRHTGDRRWAHRSHNRRRKWRRRRQRFWPQTYWNLNSVRKYSPYRESSPYRKSSPHKDLIPYSGSRPYSDSSPYSYRDSSSYRNSRQFRPGRWSPSARRAEEGRGFIRNLFGSPNYCLEEGRQFSCTLTPVCWMTGGVASTGCDSWIYSCCRPPSIGRKDKDIFEKRTRDLLENEPECGISRHRQFAKRIIGGEKAKFAELPWQAHIRISSYQCGGVLLNHWYVATAAHCVHRAKLHKISVHLGEYDTKDTEETDEPLDSHSYKVDHIIIHPDFRYMLTQPDRFDVALLHLDRPVFYQDNIIPICLPPGDIRLTGKVGIVAGWGKTDNSFGKTGTNILHKVLVPIIKNTDCIRWHEDKNILVQLHSEMFCAGHKKGKMDACLGDSGGPLVIHYNGRWTLIGITSAGFGCAVDKQPGIYHKIGRTTNWILNQINP